MKTVKSRVIVIDASVMQSAGETEHPVSLRCREALDAVLKICHRVALTHEIREEWKEHAGRYSWKWWRSMTAKRKVVNVSQYKLGPSTISALSLSEKDRKALDEDLLLIEGACADEADGIVLTRDEKICKIFENCEKHLKLPKTVKWFNPVLDDVNKLNEL